MWARAIPPGYAPLSARALLAGAWAAVAGRKEVERRLENRMAEIWAYDRLFLLDSGTTALSLALEATATSHSGPVALPAYSCYDLVTAAVGADVDVLFYDLEPATLQPVLASVERALTRGATRVVVAHLFGIPVDVRSLGPLLDRYGAYLIEDAAQGFGASVGDRPAGCLAPLSVLSFNRGKGVTGGGGGALLVREGDTAAALEGLVGPLPTSRCGCRELAMAAASWLLARPSTYALPRALPFLRLGETLYRPPAPAARMPLAAAGILTRTLPLTRATVEGQRARGRRLASLVRGVPGRRVITPRPGCECGWLRLAVLFDDPAPRAAAEGSGRLGLVRGYPRVLPDLPAIASRNRTGDSEHPGARLLAKRLYTLPTHDRVGRHEIDALRRWLDASG